jgi:tetratricopeptide (TPR) repeat protein
MNKFRSLLILSGLLCTAFKGFAQKQLIDDISSLIEQENYRRADQYLDSVLAIHPQSVDALMMKGNVVLNRVYMSVPAPEDDSELPAEETENPNASSAVVVIPREPSDTIAAYWKTCLALRPGRIDILKGLCYLYSISLRKNDLLKLLPELTERLGPADEEAYKLADYARMFRERKQFDQAIEIYREISRLYPNTRGLFSDMAGEYFSKGKFKEAVQACDSALTANVPDELSCNSCALIYTISLENQKALSALKKQMELYQTPDYWLLKGILGFRNKDSNAVVDLKKYLSMADPKTEASNTLLAGKIIELSHAFSLQDYKELLTYSFPVRFFILIDERAMEDFPESHKPFLNFACTQALYMNYTNAAAAFAKIRNTAYMSAEEAGNYHLYYGLSLEELNKPAEAMPHWERLLTSTDFYSRSAAAYFAGKYYLSKGNQEKAKALWSDILLTANQSKFSRKCANELSKLLKP